MIKFIQRGMIKMIFDKKEFLARTDGILHGEFGCDLRSANKYELYNALSRAVMQQIYPDWQREKSTGKKAVRLFFGGIFNGKVDLFQPAQSRTDGRRIRCAQRDRRRLKRIRDGGGCRPRKRRFGTACRLLSRKRRYAEHSPRRLRHSLSVRTVPSDVRGRLSA